MTKKPLALVVILTFATATASTQPPPPTQPPAPAAPAYKNLQVFPKDIPRDNLIAAMRGFTRGLGVRCNYCHVVTATEPKEELDFASDAKNEKKVARVMIQMIAQINGEWIPKAAAAEGEAEPAAGEKPIRVSCWTCHRGKTEPELPPPPPQQK
jgi:mono/diheme cytochrome c family protein